VAITLLCVGLVVGAVPVGSGLPAARADVEVHGDDAGDRYVGRGGLVLPGSVDTTTRTTVASCPGCEWRLESPCVESPHGTPFGQAARCLSVVRGCQAGTRVLRVWFHGDAGSWRDLGLVCLGRGGPVTVADVARRTREHFVAGMPPLAPTFQPSVNPVTQVPVVFSSGQPGGPQNASYTVARLAVRLQARPDWTWAFGDGVVARTTDPGAAYPLGGVVHAYRAAGRHDVTVITRWTATFTVDGLGPFPVTEPVQQEGRLTLEVGEGRALLTP
jgi:hypothetical protein